MKFLFVSSLYPKNYLEQLRVSANGLLQNAVNVFQWAVVDGLVRNDVDFKIACLPALPAYPRNYKHLYTPGGEFEVGSKPIGNMLRYNNLMAYKIYSIQYVLKKYIDNWCRDNVTSGEQLIVLTYTPNVAYIRAVMEVKKKYPQIILATIVTDLVDDMLNFASNRVLLKRIQCAMELKQTKKLYCHIDKFILLTKAMEEKIPEAVGRNIVIEGIASVNSNFQYVSKDEQTRRLLYTGTFDEFGGVRGLVDAFMKTTDPKFRLQLCGNGVLTSYVNEMCKIDSRIDYKGMVAHEESIRLQREATLVINPRKPDGGITKYSFPSKTIEYMSSGTPMIGYKLEGIPVQYYNYMYAIDDLSVAALTELINSTLSLPQNELDTKAKIAREFIVNNKTSKQQIAKIIDYLK